VTTETVSGRSIERYRGAPVTHDVRFYGSERRGRGDNCMLIAECEPCDWQRLIDGGYSIAELGRLARQHAGTEDEEP